jgi:hypothetical protein
MMQQWDFYPNKAATLFQYDTSGSFTMHCRLTGGAIVAKRRSIQTAGSDMASTLSNAFRSIDRSTSSLVNPQLNPALNNYFTRIAPVNFDLTPQGHTNAIGTQPTPSAAGSM